MAVVNCRWKTVDSLAFDSHRAAFLELSLFILFQYSCTVHICIFHNMSGIRGLHLSTFLITGLAVYLGLLGGT
jgi:hypothetical protein